MVKPYESSKEWRAAVAQIVLIHSPNHSERDPEELWEPAVNALADYYDFQGYIASEVAEVQGLYSQYDLLKWALGEAEISSAAAIVSLKDRLS